MPPDLLKYPRTHHLAGSRLQPGDEDLESLPWSELRGRYLVVEEKVDGANAGLSFDAHGALWLQSRGHFLTGGPRERHFAPFKQWAHAEAAALRAALGDRLVLYGEWLWAKHTIAYDALPAFLLEFDMLDRDTGAFLSTDRRRTLLAGTPVRSVPVLWEGVSDGTDAPTRLVGPSRFKTPRWREALRAAAVARGIDPERVLAETDPSDLAEGIYVKVEEAGQVVARHKWIRASFLTAVLDSGSHWLDRPIVPNRLAPEAAP